jgi:hypothetical protein
MRGCLANETLTGFGRTPKKPLTPNPLSAKRGQGVQPRQCFIEFVQFSA